MMEWIRTHGSEFCFLFCSTIDGTVWDLFLLFSFLRYECDTARAFTGSTWMIPQIPISSDHGSRCFEILA